jgi:hypothetical protein
MKRIFRHRLRQSTRHKPRDDKFWVDGHFQKTSDQ